MGGMFDTIVLATDGSDSAERAVTLALDLAGRFDADVYACYVCDETADTDDGADALAAVTDRDSSVTTVTREGDPAAEICAYAEEIAADLVVTGTRGRGGANGTLLGSVAEAVVGQSPVPVLTARLLEEDADVDVPVPNGGS